METKEAEAVEAKEEVEMVEAEAVEAKEEVEMVEAEEEVEATSEVEAKKVVEKEEKVAKEVEAQTNWKLRVTHAANKVATSLLLTCRADSIREKVEAKEVEAKEVAGHGAGEATKPSPTL